MLLAEARLFGASKGKLVVRDLERIDPRVSRLELLDRPIRGGHGGGPDRRPEAELRVVGESKTFVEVFDAADRQRGPEDLLGPHPSAVRHVLQDRRLDEPTLLILGALGLPPPLAGLAAPAEASLTLRPTLSA